jgi:hypothetical protein
MVHKEVGSVLVEFEDRHISTVLLCVTEENGNIFINSKFIPASYNVEESIRWIMKIPISAYIMTTHFKTEPHSHHRRSDFPKSWWQDYAISKVIVTATVLVSKMDYESAGYDSV